MQGDFYAKKFFQTKAVYHKQFYQYNQQNKVEFKTEFVCDAPFWSERTPLRKVPLQGDLGVQTRIFFQKKD